jgi:hypothetical protein
MMTVVLRKDILIYQLVYQKSMILFEYFNYYTSYIFFFFKRFEDIKGLIFYGEGTSGTNMCQLTLKDCSFINCVVADKQQKNGSVFLILYTKLTLTNCKFISCSSTYDGGID